MSYMDQFIKILIQLRFFLKKKEEKNEEAATTHDINITHLPPNFGYGFCFISCPYIYCYG